jgi:hypothetical protein
MRKEAGTSRSSISKTEIPCLLGDEGDVRVPRCASYVNAAGADLDEEQHVEGLEEGGFTVKKSHAKMPWAWARRNSDQLGPAPRGAGPSPSLRRILCAQPCLARLVQRHARAADPPRPVGRGLRGRPRSCHVAGCGGAQASGGRRFRRQLEPRRESWRLHPLRGWSHDQIDQVPA